VSKQRITQILERARIPTKFPKRQTESLGVTYIGEASGHGSGLYVRLPKEVCDYFGLVSGDRIMVRLVERKRWTEVEEAD
jgi:hypothetical protein